MTQICKDRFNGKTVLVTGAGSGIGRAAALRFAAEGARVIATDLRQDRLDTLMAEIGANHTNVAGDIAGADTISTLLAAAGTRIDALVNNAGIMDGFLPASEVDDATWDRVLAVNLTGPMRLCRAVLPGMIKAGAGSIVNVSSEAGLRGSSAGAAYTTSKHALIGLTRHIAFAYGPKGVRCNTVAPGAVQTAIEAPFLSPDFAARVGPILQATMPGVAQPEELAATICWLASDDASNMNGAVVACDGGWSAV